MSDNHHEEAHTGPIKNPKQLLVAVLFSFVIPIFAIIGLVLYVTSADMPAAGAVNPEKAIAERIQKVGMVEIRDANRPLRAGEEVYKGQCAACHATGAAGAPKFADAGAWTARIATGFETLVQSALKGKGAMAPQGGGDFNDTEIARAVAYMANAAGAKFAEPGGPRCGGGGPGGGKSPPRRPRHAGDSSSPRRGSRASRCRAGGSGRRRGRRRSPVQAGLPGVPCCRRSRCSQVW